MIKYFCNNCGEEVDPKWFLPVWAIQYERDKWIQISVLSGPSKENPIHLCKKCIAALVSKEAGYD